MWKIKNRRRKILVNKPVQFTFTGLTIYFTLITIIIVGGFTYFITLNTIIAQLELENKLVNAYEIIKNINILLLKKIGIFVLILLILVFYLEIRFLHRVAGPLFRIERTLKEISEGKDVEPIKLRKKDFYKSLAESVNKVIEYINKLKKN
jgi:signal transduction histidine kinase